MKLTKIIMEGYHTAPTHKPIADVVSNIVILVPDLDSFHEVSGQAFLLNKVWKIHLLEPGKEYKWDGMFSPWHLNTDAYRLTFTDRIAVYTPRP